MYKFYTYEIYDVTAVFHIIKSGAKPNTCFNMHVCHFYFVIDHKGLVFDLLAMIFFLNLYIKYVALAGI